MRRLWQQIVRQKQSENEITFVEIHAIKKNEFGLRVASAFKKK